MRVNTNLLMPHPETRWGPASGWRGCCSPWSTHCRPPRQSWGREEEENLFPPSLLNGINLRIIAKVTLKRAYKMLSFVDVYGHVVDIQLIRYIYGPCLCVLNMYFGPQWPQMTPKEHIFSLQFFKLQKDLEGFWRLVSWLFICLCLF